MATLHIEPKIEATGQLSTLQLKGDFTAMDAMDSRSEIIDFISRNNGEIVLDLRSVEVIDLAGINILAMAQRSAEVNQKELQIQITSSGNITEWIQMTKMDKLLNIQTIN
ncbi:MAG: STAS domain-containing protein [Saprospiraceae bacterium]|nr:STAS domain-containing protein [Saprospiraceae bacterium]